MASPDFNAQADRLIQGLRAAMDKLGPPASGLIPTTLGAPTAQTPSDLPVLTQFHALVAHAPPTAMKALQTLQALAPQLAWRQTYHRPAVSEQFLQNYGWTELIGPTALYTAPDVSVGVLFLGPDTYYPMHQHEALEHYVPLSGQAEWYNEDLGWRKLPALQVIVHRPWVKHAMRTRTEPMMALYQWSGPGVGGSAKLT